MRGMNGLEVIEAVREKVNAAFIIFSGYDKFEYARKALELQSVVYLLKPSGVPEIEAAIKRRAVLCGSAQAAGRGVFEQQHGSGDPRLITGKPCRTKVFDSFQSMCLLVLSNVSGSREAFYEEVQAVLKPLPENGNRLFDCLEEKKVVILAACEQERGMMGFHRRVRGALQAFQAQSRFPFFMGESPFFKSPADAEQADRKRGRYADAQHVYAQADGTGKRRQGRKPG